MQWLFCLLAVVVGTRRWKVLLPSLEMNVASEDRGFIDALFGGGSDQVRLYWFTWSFRVYDIRHRG